MWNPLSLFRSEPEPTEARRTAVEDVWDDLWGFDASDQTYAPTDKELETATGQSGIAGPAIRELTETCGKSRPAGDVRTVALLESPNENQDWTGLAASIIRSYMATGAAYILPKPVGSVAPEELFVLRTSDITIRPGPISDPYRAIYYNAHRERATFDRSDLIIWMAPGFTHPAYPHAPLREVWDTIAADIARERAKKMIGQKVAHMMGLVETNDRTKKKQRDDLAKSLKDQIGAPVIVLPGGAKMQFPDLRAVQLFEADPQQAEARVCAALNVPPILAGFQVGLESMTYSNYQEARNSFYDETIEPLLTGLAGAISRDLGVEIEFELDKPSTGDRDEGEATVEDDAKVINMPAGGKNAAAQTN